jgi:pimeloyl-ACP methyl ester carboxylesterase
MAKSSDVILVHGAWADGSSWAKVIPLLAARGHSVTAVQLPLTSLRDDVATVKRAIALASGPLILAGHSYGGAVISEAGNDPKVEALVYIAAFATDAGESAGSLGASVEPAPLGAEVRPDAEGYLKLTQPGVSDSFAQDLTDTEKLVLYSAQSPTAGAALGGTISSPAWRGKTCRYLVASNDRAIQPALQRTMAKRLNAAVVEVASSHVAMLSHPQDVASLIAG